MSRRRVIRIGERLPDGQPRGVDPDLPDWQQCSPAWIARALARAEERSGGGWYVLDGRRVLGRKPRRYEVAGRELVLYRGEGGRPTVASDACPHLGASLSTGCVRGGKIVCPWHGLALGPGRHGAWRPLPIHDDGVLLWVRLPAAGETPLPAPRLPSRPAHALDAVVRLVARCDPADVVANRLDPWHGAHFHPHTFSALHVVERLEDEITVRVAYRVAGPVGVEVDARFHCPDRRSIVMTIVRGEGRGSVVETHATPLGDGRTAIVEATLAASERPVVRAVFRLAAPLLRCAMRRAARRLWVEDAAYAERLAELRRRGLGPSARGDAASPPARAATAGAGR